MACYNSFWDYDESPFMRKGGIIARIGIDCGLGGICVGFINNKASFLHLHALEIFAWGLIWFGLAAISASAIYLKLAGREAKTVKYKKSDLPWSDPYRLLEKSPNNDPSKKTYYIVDSEKNAIVDVKRLGKWGQRYIEWRGKRQREKRE